MAGELEQSTERERSAELARRELVAASVGNDRATASARTDNWCHSRTRAASGMSEAR